MLEYEFYLAELFFYVAERTESSFNKGQTTTDIPECCEVQAIFFTICRVASKNTLSVCCYEYVGCDFLLQLIYVHKAMSFKRESALGFDV